MILENVLVILYSSLIARLFTVIPLFFRNNASFTHSHVQRVPGSPTQNGSNFEIKFYVDYPGGCTMPQEIIIIIMNEKVDSIGGNAGLNLAFLTTVVPPIAMPSPPPININNSISVVLKNFTTDEVRYSGNSND